MQAERASDIFKGELAAVLASVLIGGLDNDLWVQIMQAGMFYRQGVLGGYSVVMEKRADAGAVKSLLNTPWDPVGLLTFMERLAAEERSHAYPDMGVFKTHPLSSQRVTYLLEDLISYGVPINRRHTANWDKPAAEVGKVGDKDAQLIKFQSEQVFACDTPREGQKDAAERAGKVAETLTEVLTQGAQAMSFRSAVVDGRPAVKAYDTTIFVVTEADEALFGKAAQQIVQASLKAIRNGISREKFGRLY